MSEAASTSAPETTGARPAVLPWAHLGLGSLAVLLLLIGGTATFGSWGTLEVRVAMLYVLAALGLHAASRQSRRAGLPLRLGAWASLLALTVHQQVLLRAEVVVPLLALAALDITLHRAELTNEVLTASRLSKAIAAVATVVMVLALVALVLLAADGLVLARLGATVLVGWALLVVLALRPHLRTPLHLLGASGVLSVTFLLLAAPVMPFGPLLAYWVLIASMAVAVLTSTVSGTDHGLDPAKRRHAQRVHPMPDPVIAPLREDVRVFLTSGEGASQLSRRLEQALGRDENGRLLPALSEARAKGTVPSRADRARALAELLEIDIERYRTEESA